MSLQGSLQILLYLDYILGISTRCLHANNVFVCVSSLCIFMCVCFQAAVHTLLTLLQFMLITSVFVFWLCSQSFCWLASHHHPPPPPPHDFFFLSLSCSLFSICLSWVIAELFGLVNHLQPNWLCVATRTFILQAVLNLKSIRSKCCLINSRLVLHNLKTSTADPPWLLPNTLEVTWRLKVWRVTSLQDHHGDLCKHSISLHVRWSLTDSPRQEWKQRAPG